MTPEQVLDSFRINVQQPDEMKRRLSLLNTLDKFVLSAALATVLDRLNDKDFDFIFGVMKEESGK